MNQERIDWEKADRVSHEKTRLVCGSVQSLKTESRLQRLGRKRFDLIIIDEGHHAISASYRKVLDWFSDAKVLLVTATPNRGDKKALGKIVDDVVYEFDILQGIDEGYLVPIDGREVKIASLDLEAVDANRGELVAAALENAVIKAVEGIVDQTMKQFPDKRGIFFFPGVKSAEYAAEKFNAVEPNSTIVIHGKTEENLRRSLTAQFKAGRFKRLCNCEIATEGFDAPNIDMVGMGRPTLSESLYRQMAGRGTRVLPGVVDHLWRKEQADERRDAIARSAKPKLLLVDFVGNPGRHSLASSVDILAGDYSDKEVELAKKKKKAAPEADVRALLEQARSELLAIARGVRAKSEAHVASFDPFQCFGIKRPKSNPSWGDEDMMATLPQRERLIKRGIPEKEAMGMTKREASRLIGEMDQRMHNGLATLKQMRQLSRFGITRADVTFKAASEAMNYLASVKFGRGDVPVDQAKLVQLAYGDFL